MFTAFFVFMLFCILGVVLLPWLLLKLVTGIFQLLFGLIGGMFSLMFGLATGLLALVTGLFAAFGAALALIVLLPLVLAAAALFAFIPVLLPIAAVVGIVWLIVALARRSSAPPSPLSLPPPHPAGIEATR